jgi:hypothetical protein
VARFGQKKFALAGVGQAVEFEDHVNCSVPVVFLESWWRAALYKVILNGILHRKSGSE